MNSPEFAKAFAADWIGETIATAIEDKLKELGMTKKQLAVKLGCSPPNVSRWLRNPNAMSLTTVAKLLLVLELDLAVVPGPPGRIKT